MSFVPGILKAVLVLVTAAQGGLPIVPEIPVRLPDSVRQPLIAKRQPLAERKMALREAGRAIDESCSAVERGSLAHRNCLDRASKFAEQVEALTTAMDQLTDEIDAAIRTHTISSMNALADSLGWQAAERARLNRALESLGSDGDSFATLDEVRRTWRVMLAREGGDFAREAAGGSGPGMPGTGTQSFEDCAIFALANAAGLTYGVAAARATRLIRRGEWRDADDRSNPRRVIESEGLIGGEVVMLAEAFGQVEVVPSSAFARTLREGRPVMVNIVAQGLNGDHQVVLTKTFSHGGATWYEMMDSNQGPLRRLYLSATELDTLLRENGVTIRPEPGTTPKLLRKRGQ